MTPRLPLVNLVKRVRACQLCSASLPLGPRPILQVATRAKILVAAQAPGTRVHETGIPFDDPSGVRLRSWMGIAAEVFYDPTQVALLPMGFCYPGRGKSGDLPPRPECAPAWRQQVLDLLPNIQLTLVIGQYAQAWHLGGKAKGRTLTAVVQDWENLGPDIIPMPHPSPRNNIWLRRNPWFEDDVIPHLRERVSQVLV